ncbi:DUF262 domain-containing protein [Vibrio splendidus]|nr:DUF262 domain-containing protein [Vibrio splendidus]MCC4882558.1 DUF262 domain-containing protein [Vibrio splendidus]
MIKSICYACDHLVEAKFDASGFFEHAKKNGTLQKCVAEFIEHGFIESIPSDQVAKFFRDTLTKVVFDHNAIQRDKLCGFECNVDKQDVISWLARNDCYSLSCMIESKASADILTAKVGEQGDVFDITYLLDGATYSAKVSIYDNSSIEDCDFYGASVHDMFKSMFSEVLNVEGWKITSVCGYDKESSMEIIKSEKQNEEQEQNDTPMLPVFDAFIEHARYNAFSYSTYSAGTDLYDCLNLIARFCNRNEYLPFKDVDASDNVEIAASLRDIILNKAPVFQRDNDKWTREMQTGFVHNLLKGHKANPISLYTVEESKTNCFVLDGLQRITALCRFFAERDMEFPLPDGRMISAEDIFAKGINYSFWNNSPFNVNVYHFKTELEAVDFYIEFNENITHSPEDIQRAIEYRKTLVQAS